nr:putative ribonuclease H-like domain-containing protein [Tanacetum cinerariifolium]
MQQISKEFSRCGFQPSSDSEKKVDEDPSKGSKCRDQEKEDNVNSTNNVNATSTNRVNVVSENITRLVAQGHTQEKEIDYDEVFAPVAKIEAIRLCLAYASFEDFVVYQMDVKSVFLYEKIEEEVYVCQPPGFEDPDFSDKVYKLKRYKGHILLVQVYVDDIIFGSTKKELCIAFKKMMHEKFQMSSMGELTFFLGLQVKQKQDGVFISQDKYVTKILKKYRFTEVKNASIPMETPKHLLKDEYGEEVDFYMYRLMIGSLMYLTSSRPDIIDYAGARLDRKSTTGGCQYLGCRFISWQCKKQTVVANSITKAEYVYASKKAKKNVRLMMDELFEMELELILLFWTTARARTINGKEQIHAKVDGKKVIISESSIRRDLQFGDEEGVDCLPTAIIFEQLALMEYEKLSQKLIFYKLFFSQQ